MGKLISGYMGGWVPVGGRGGGGGGDRRGGGGGEVIFQGHGARARSSSSLLKIKNRLETSKQP